MVDISGILRILFYAFKHIILKGDSGLHKNAKGVHDTKNKELLKTSKAVVSLETQEFSVMEKEAREKK